MFLLISVNGEVRQCGTAPDTPCPVCGSRNTLHVFCRYLMPRIFFLPTVRLRREYAATCAHCASLLEVEPHAGRAFERAPNKPLPLGSLHIRQAQRPPL